MKIAIVCKNISFIAGGPRLLFNLAHHLQEFGHTVIIYAADAGSSHFEEIAKGLRIITVKLDESDRGKGSAQGFFGRIMDKLDREREEILLAKKTAAMMDLDFDIVNVHDFAYRTGLFYKQRNPKAGIVWNENATLFVYVNRGKFLQDFAGHLYWFIKKWTDKKYFLAMDRMVVLDNYNKRRREAAGGHDVVVVRCGVDIEKFYAPVKDFRERAARKEISLLAVGALNSARRFDVVIEAVRLMRKDGYNAHATIVAHNIWHEDETRKKLEAQVRDAHLEAYIRLNFEGLPEVELIKTFQACDVFVQAVYAPPPAHHGWGIVNFEAISAGVPVIITRSATATEVLEDGKSALFFEPLHAEQIAEKARFLIDNPDEYQKIAAAGQRYVQENLSWKKLTEGMIAVFRDAIGS